MSMWQKLRGRRLCQQGPIWIRIGVRPPPRRSRLFRPTSASRDRRRASQGRGVRIAVSDHPCRDIAACVFSRRSAGRSACRRRSKCTTGAVRSVRCGDRRTRRRAPRPAGGPLRQTTQLLIAEVHRAIKPRSCICRIYPIRPSSSVIKARHSSAAAQNISEGMCPHAPCVAIEWRASIRGKRNVGYQ